MARVRTRRGEWPALVTAVGGLGLGLEPLRRRMGVVRISLLGVEKNVAVIHDYQVKTKPGGPWHRRGVVDGETACGEPIGPITHHRGSKLDGKVCHDCHSLHEIALGIAHEAAEHDAKYEPED